MSHIFLNGQAIRTNNIFCIGRNYVAHIAELGNETPSEPLVFLKPNSAILNSGGEIRLPSFSGNVHYEAELVLLIGGDAEGLAEGRELDIVAGYAVGLDLTARDIQDELKSKGWPWTKAKGFKGAACMSAFVPAARLPDPMHCTFDFYINGELRQHGDTSIDDLQPARDFARLGGNVRPAAGRFNLYRHALRCRQIEPGRPTGLGLGRFGKGRIYRFGLTIHMLGFIKAV